MPNDQQDLMPLQQLLTLLRPMPTPAAPVANNTPIPPIMGSGAWQRRAADRQAHPEHYPNSMPQPGIGSNIGSFLMRALQSIGDYARQQNQQRQQQLQQFQKTGHLTPGYASSEGGAVSPMAGTIAPESTMTPLAQAMMQNIEKNYPEFYQKLVKAVPMLMPFVQVPESGSYGTLRMNRPSVEMAQKVGQPAAAEQATHGVLQVRPTEALTTTPIHEGQHFLNFPRVQQTEGTDAATIGTLLRELLPVKGQGSLMNRANEYNVRAPAGVAGTPKQLAQMPNVLQALSEPAHPSFTQPVFGAQGYYKPGELTKDFLGRSMMDEGLAYLSEHSIPGSQPQGPNIANMNINLIDLARKLGVDVK